MRVRWRHSHRDRMAWLRRLILFLQQSSVEWASSLWMHVVQELDPEFKRTVRAVSCCLHQYSLAMQNKLSLHCSSSFHRT